MRGCASCRVVIITGSIHLHAVMSTIDDHLDPQRENLQISVLKAGLKQRRAEKRSLDTQWGHNLRRITGQEPKYWRNRSISRAALDRISFRVGTFWRTSRSLVRRKSVRPSRSWTSSCLEGEQSVIPATTPKEKAGGGQRSNHF